MSKICQVTGKKPIFGNSRSHSMNANKRRFNPNIHCHKFWLEDQKKFIKLNVSIHGMRIINKLGIKLILNRLKLKIKK